MAGIPLLLFGAAALADQGLDDIKCLPEGHSQIEVKKDEVVYERAYTVPRRQVLMEMITSVY